MDCTTLPKVDKADTSSAEESVDRTTIPKVDKVDTSSTEPPMA
jgi:hypothetical protein